MEADVALKQHLARIRSITLQKTKKIRIFQFLALAVFILEIIMLNSVFNGLYNWKFNGEINHDYIKIFWIMVGLYVVFAGKQKLLRLQSPYGWVEEILQTLKVVFYAFVFTIAFLFIMKVSIVYSRAIVLLFFSSMFLLSWFVRLSKRLILTSLAYFGFEAKNVLIVGAGKVGVKIRDFFSERKSYGINVVGFLDDNNGRANVLGTLQDIQQAVERYQIDEVIVTLPSERAYINRVIESVHRFNVKVKIIPELYDLVTTKVAFDQIKQFPMVEVVDQKSILDKFIKRFMDITLSAIGMVVLFPVVLTLCVLVKLDSKGPAVFRQKRIGKNGHPFYIHKFRSMIMNAEEVLRQNEVLYNKYVENNYKLEPHEDPRITKTGRFLRKTILDEIPQLWNVFKGEMSLVGPRPVVEDELKEYEDRITEFLSAKPGVTGYWQVSGRSDVGYPERVDMELYYVYNQSLLLDIKIIIKTVLSVIKRDGAY